MLNKSSLLLVINTHIKISGAYHLFCCLKQNKWHFVAWNKDDDNEITKKHNTFIMNSWFHILKGSLILLSGIHRILKKMIKEKQKIINRSFTFCPKAFQKFLLFFYILNPSKNIPFKKFFFYYRFLFCYPSVSTHWW